MPVYEPLRVPPASPFHQRFPCFAGGTPLCLFFWALDKDSWERDRDRALAVLSCEPASSSRHPDLSSRHPSSSASSLFK
eukprot:CAMPEP_0180628544 /NCGR_PEP_ID=MMETSP1037_2-20121125/38988_1 /TAXON_ID=632150 /ORGANISM="Azadinium spinosum, Strain 3D9" /LENGTH=78 /DNA_ID=CAMNT_0022649293 /DNA_START=863 /DNA_END=1096 /DNA_ORIENTATION=-